MGGGGPGGGGAGVRGLLATFLQTTLPHAESTEISGALEGIASERAGGRQPGDHTGEPPPAPSPGPRRAPPVSVPHTAGPARWLPRIPHFQPLNPGFPPPPRLPFRPHPPLRGAVALSQAHRRPHPREAPPAHSLRAPQGKKMRPDEPERATAGVGAREGEGEGTYFSRRGVERCRREIKARIRAALNPANAVMSARQPGRRWRPQGTGTGTGTGARAAGARAALRLGPRLRAAPLLAPLWLLAPTPGSHMTPAPLALRASRGWRGK